MTTTVTNRIFNYFKRIEIIFKNTSRPAHTQRDSRLHPVTIHRDYFFLFDISVM